MTSTPIAGPHFAGPPAARPAPRRKEGRYTGLLLPLLLLWAATGLLPGNLAVAQGQAMGTVATRDARVTGGLEVRGDQAQLLTNTSVTAYDRTAPISLARGGQVLVCSTSEFHLLRSGTEGALIFGLNRGALEIRSRSQLRDVILTPDLKLTPVTPGALDLSLRVTPEGDTCVENAGAGAPVLSVNDAFSSANYRILPGQHVLFVKGDLHRVVDHERSPCGCPPAGTAQQAVAAPGHPLTPAQAAAAAHPFPEAQSAGLAPIPPPSNAAPVGTASSQVTTTFSYADGQGTPPPGAPSPAASFPASAVTPPPASKPVRNRGFGARLRHFFHHLFHSSSTP